MKPYYENSHIKIYHGDCRNMGELPDKSVQCVVTSPPYWGLRKYSGEQDLIWGGDKDCQHEWGEKKVTRRGHPGTKSTLVGTQTAELSKAVDTFGSMCILCGAFKCGYGLEPTPEMYVQHTIEILREIRRVLRKDGVVFWDIGDSYGSGKGTCFNPGGGKGSFSGHGNRKDAGAYPLDRGSVSMLKASGLKPKDLCLIPFRVAIAAQEDGWWVRSVIIWSKPNPMPESVTDRPTESHEYILMLTKSARYYWDADAVREPIAYPEPRWGLNPKYDEQQGGLSKYDGGEHSGRNIRTVWEFPTEPYPEAHFAVFPEKLPELCIKAATPEVGCCSKCGAPWVRITKPTDDYAKLLGTWTPDTDADPELRKKIGFAAHGKKVATTAQYETLGWQPTCKCNATRVPSVVLDPFAGACTTLWVAKKLGRQAVGYELSEEYCQLALERNRQQVMAL